jgi:hypothetical protein
MTGALHTCDVYVLAYLVYPAPEVCDNMHSQVIITGPIHQIPSSPWVKGAGHESNYCDQECV